MFELGQYFINQMQYSNGMEWLLKAAGLGCQKSMNLIGRMYHNGEGVEKDLNRALEWYSKAAKLGSTVCMKGMADVYLLQNKFLDCSIWLDC